MKKLDIGQLGKKKEEIAEALIFLVLGRPVARTLAYLNTGDDATSNELETVTGLPQPQVSIVMRHLKEHDWINEREEKKKVGKGRPYKIYSLKVGFNDIIAQLEKQQKKAVEETQATIERLRNWGIVFKVQPIALQNSLDVFQVLLHRNNFLFHI